MNETKAVEAICNRIKQKGIKQKKICSDLGIHPSTLSRIIHNKETLTPGRKRILFSYLGIYDPSDNLL
jgi:plasmid maintenance system antidote protein VapI